MLSDFQQLINAWEIPFYAGWSIMDLFRLVALLITVSIIVNYFFGTAGGTK